MRRAAGVVRVHLHSSTMVVCESFRPNARPHGSGRPEYGRGRTDLCQSPTLRSDRGRSTPSAPGGSGVSSSATSSGSASTGSHSCVHASRGLRVDVGEMPACVRTVTAAMIASWRCACERSRERACVSDACGMALSPYRRAEGSQQHGGHVRERVMHMGLLRLARWARCCSMRPYRGARQQFDGANGV